MPRKAPKALVIPPVSEVKASPPSGKLSQSFVQTLINYDQDKQPEIRTEAEWVAQGLMLGWGERKVGWAIGAWWNAGERFGERVRIVSDPAWAGPSYKTCREYASVVSRIPVSRRLDNLSFHHHHAVAALPEEEGDRILLRASEQARETGQAPPVQALRQAAKAQRRQDRERDMSEAARVASVKLGRKLYPVILADPPWRFAPWSDETGMDRAPDNHYPTMSIEAMAGLKVPAADDCVLFLWATVPMLPEALKIMDAWGFRYRSNMAWAKDQVGTGYWFRNQHELLLVGGKGHPPAPAPGEQYSSLQSGKIGKHSEKPTLFHEIIDDMFPTADKLEMFARRNWAGWDSWGTEAPLP